MRTARLPLVVLVLALALPGACDRSPRPQPEKEKLKVLATAYPLADIARQIGGSNVSVDWIFESGQSLSLANATAQLRNRLRVADLVVTGGASEMLATQGFDEPLQARRIIRLDLLPGTRDRPAFGMLWLDPDVAKQAAQELSDRLATMRPAREQFFRQRTATFCDEVDRIVREFAPGLATGRTRRMLTFGSDFDWLLQRFNLEPALVLQTAPGQITAAQIPLLRSVASQNNTSVLLVPADTPLPVIRDLQSRSGLKVVPLETLGTSAAGGRNSYQQILRYNLEQLAAATAG